MTLPDITLIPCLLLFGSNFMQKSHDIYQKLSLEVKPSLFLSYWKSNLQVRQHMEQRKVYIFKTSFKIINMYIF